MKRALWLSAAFLAACASSSSSQNGEDDSEFRARFESLKDASGGPVLVTLGGSESAIGTSRLALKRKKVRSTLSPNDILEVVNENMRDVKTCYKKQLDEDPEWADDLILDLAVKKTGKLSEMNISPGRVRRDVIGRCLGDMVPAWSFPKFTGETPDGMSQEVVSASFPLSFSNQ